MTGRIEDYALIGDMCTAALVCNDGSIDWLCLPRFDSAACFASLLGDRENGRWLIAPAGGVKAVNRAYRDGSLILDTTFTTEDGAVTLTDFMPINPSDDGVERADLVRVVHGVRGRVEMQTELILRFAYGSAVPWVRRRGHGITAIAGPDAVVIQTPVELHGANLTTVAEFEVREGDSIPFVLTWHPSHRPPPSDIDPLRALEMAEKQWAAWSSRARLPGRYEAPALRSLVTLKALTFSPTGGIVAAPTTSLPETLGGVRNWDYRFCWLRDATFTLYALLTSGFQEEARAWRDWLLRAVAGKPSQLQTIYGIGGERLLPEFELDWLRGFAGSAPVRIGNAAHRQLQLDVYGEVIDTLEAARREGLPLHAEAWRVESAILRFLEKAWTRKDSGLWEVRGAEQHFTHSKLMTWVAFDRAIKAAESAGLFGPLDRWRAIRAEIAAAILEKGFDRDRGAFVQSFGSKNLDAAVLLVPLVGFLPADDPRVVSTVGALERELMHDGVLRRYSGGGDVDGLPGAEGAFLACSFWFVDNLAMIGREDDAMVMFERLLSLRNDVGLLAEEYDPVGKRQLGTFPQAFSHVGLVNSAHNLASVHGARPGVRRAAAAH
jgi:GH15 family glucan-1,4-alpha-glucosidase